MAYKRGTITVREFPLPLNMELLTEPGKKNLMLSMPSTSLHCNSIRLKNFGSRKAKLMEQSIEMPTDPLHAETIEQRQTNGMQCKNTQQPV
jgi:hypothetical protein